MENEYIDNLEIEDNDDLAIGEWVVEPTLGICQVQGIRYMKFNNKEEEFFAFHASSSTSNASVLVPKSQLKRRGIRRPINLDKIKKLFVQLKTPTTPVKQEARVQYNAYNATLLSGCPNKISRMLRDLYSLEQGNDLKGKEKEMREKAFKFLQEEIAWVRGDKDTKKAEEEISEALRQMYKKKVQKDREAKKKN